MTAQRILARANALILGTVGLCAAATGVLVAFPGDLRVWQAASWTMSLALLCLLVLVGAAAWALATDRATRTWSRVLCVTLGAGCLAFIAIAAI